MADKQTNEQANNGQTIIVNNVQKKSNGIGTAGFVLSLIAIFLVWVPLVDFVLWFLGFIFSFIGIFKSPRGLAITGLIISLIGIVLILTIFGGLLALSN